jgi:hypothetical protein
MHLDAHLLALDVEGDQAVGADTVLAAVEGLAAVLRADELRMLRTVGVVEAAGYNVAVAPAVQAEWPLVRTGFELEKKTYHIHCTSVQSESWRQPGMTSR